VVGGLCWLRVSLFWLRLASLARTWGLWACDGSFYVEDVVFVGQVAHSLSLAVCTEMYRGGVLWGWVIFSGTEV